MVKATAMSPDFRISQVTPEFHIPSEILCARDGKSLDRRCGVTFQKISLHGFLEHMFDDRQTPIHGNGIKPFARFRFPLLDLPRCYLR